MAWTPELIKDLKRLWNKGLTTVEIGNRIGMSKNAVVGKAHRLGLEGRPSPIKKSAKKTLLVEEDKKSEAPIAEQQADVDELESSSFPPEELLTAEPLPENLASDGDKQNGVQLVDLKPNSCRWPLGDPKDADFCFCGQECVSGKIYCEEHCAVAYTGVFKAR